MWVTNKDYAGRWSGRWLWRSPNFAAVPFEGVCAWACPGEGGVRGCGLAFASAVADAGARRSADAGEG